MVAPRPDGRRSQNPRAGIVRVPSHPSGQETARAGLARRARRRLRRHRHLAALRDRECFTRRTRRRAATHRTPDAPRTCSACCRWSFWSLILVVVVKYLMFVLRADNKGEGGILALAALVDRRRRRGDTRSRLGDPDPARAVRRRPAVRRRHHHAGDLGARRGRGPLRAEPDASADLVVPITVAILVGLFLVQKHGTAGSARCSAGDAGVVRRDRGARRCLDHRRAPRGAAARRPALRRRCSSPHHGMHGFLLLGSVVLVHHRRRGALRGHGPLRQAADPDRLVHDRVPGAAPQLLRPGRAATSSEGPTRSTNPFYDAGRAAPLLIPMVVLATMAAVIASQALISGAFSLTSQAVQLGYLPRVTVVHTSSTTEGQIYIPEVNWLLMVACIALVLAFRSSSTPRRGLRHRGHRHDGDHLVSCSSWSAAATGAGSLAAALALVPAVPRDRPDRSSPRTS